MAWLHGRKALSALQSARLGDLLWAGDEDGALPQVPQVRSVDYPKLPHPSEIDPEPRVKEYLRSTAARRLQNDVLDELRRSARVIEWTPSEVGELVRIVTSWWEKNQQLLQLEVDKPLGSPADDTRDTARVIVDALAALVPLVSAGGEGDVVAMELRDFVGELKHHRIPVLRLEIANPRLLNQRRQEVIDRIGAELLGSEPSRVQDALAGAWLLADQLGKEAYGEFDLVATRLVQGIQWRHEVVLAHRLRCVAGLVERHAWFLTEETKSAVLEGLAGIAEETASGVTANDVDGVIGVRSEAATLAYRVRSISERRLRGARRSFFTGGTCVAQWTSSRKSGTPGWWKKSKRIAACVVQELQAVSGSTL